MNERQAALTVGLVIGGTGVALLIYALETAGNQWWQVFLGSWFSLLGALIVITSD